MLQSKTRDITNDNFYTSAYISSIPKNKSLAYLHRFGVISKFYLILFPFKEALSNHFSHPLINRFEEY
jgi:hypothetical protein